MTFYLRFVLLSNIFILRFVFARGSLTRGSILEVSCFYKNIDRMNRIQIQTLNKFDLNTY